MFIAAAILTPSPDALSQVLMAIPLLFLYEISIFVAKFAARKKAATGDHDDSEAT
jgi:sec-independent protein translocase protein TatC